MASIFKNLFRSKKANSKQPSAEREEERRESGRRGVARRGSRYETVDVEISATAPFHTATQPRTHRGPRSCPGTGPGIDTFNEFDRYANRSFDSDCRHPRDDVLLRRRGFRGKHVHHRNVTSEYGSCDPSPTNLFSTYNRNLDDSESDSWALDSEKSQRILELENILHEHRRKLKVYKERLRAERDLRTVNERNLMEELERIKRERRREERERKEFEQRCMETLSFLQTQLAVQEQARYSGGLGLFGGPCSSTAGGGMTLGAGESLCAPSNGSFLSRPLNFSKSSVQDSIDETKNFRHGEATDLEAPRGGVPFLISSSSITSNNTADERTTILEGEDSDGGYATTSEGTSRPTLRRVRSDSHINRIPHTAYAFPSLPLL